MGRSSIITAKFGIFIMLVFSCIETWANNTAHLKDMLDSAAKSGEKIVEISGETLIDSDLIITEKHSGITLRGKDGAKLVFSKRINSWVREGNILKASLPDAQGGMLSLFVNGRRAQNAYLPKKSFFWSAGKCSIDGSFKPQKGFYALPLLVHSDAGNILCGLSKEELKNSYLQMFCVWNEFKFAIASLQSNGNDYLSLTLLSDQNYNTFRWDNAPRFRLVNIKSALTEEGEFYFDSTKREIFYLPRKGENENNIQAYYSPKASHIIIEGKEESPVENFNIENLHFEYAGQQRKPNGVITLMGQAANEADSLVKIRNARNISILSCDFKNIDPYAVNFGVGSKDSKIENCAFSSMGTGAIRIGESKKRHSAEGILVRNNAIAGYGEFNLAAVAIFAQDAPKVAIINNSISEGFYTGISVGWTWGFGKTSTRDMSVCNNKISNIGKGWIDDMGGIYTLGACPNSKISGNDISNISRHRYGAWGIYNDEGSSGWIIENNHVKNCQDDSYFMHYGKNVVVRNNIFEDSEVSQVGLGRTADNSFVYTRNILVFSDGRLLRNDYPLPPKAVKFSKNIYWNRNNKPINFAGYSFDKWKSFDGRDEGSFIENPHLENYSDNNPSFKKIGFKTFKLGEAGASKDVLSRLKGLSCGVKLTGRAPHAPDYSPYGAENSTNYPSEFAGGLPSNVELPSDFDKTAVAVKTDGEKKYIRLESNSDKTKRSKLIFKFRAPKGEVFSKIELRLYPDSELLIRFNKNNKGNELSISKGSLKFEGASENIDIFSEWLEFSIAITKDNRAVCNISNEGEIIKSFETQFTGKGDFSSLTISAPKGGNSHTDIGEVRVGPNSLKD